MLQLDQNNHILIDSKPVNLGLTQAREGTKIYTPEHCPGGYREHKMPHARYSSMMARPHKPGQGYDPEKCAGVHELEADLRALVARLAAEASCVTKQPRVST
jgi:hypothetical protein